VRGNDCGDANGFFFLPFEVGVEVVLEDMVGGIDVGDGVRLTGGNFLIGV
jgi:hypothetical protein